MSERTRFFERRERGSHVSIAWEYRDEIDALALHLSGRLEATLAAATPLAGGRVGAFRVRLPGSGRTLHVRTFAHGGWLRALTGRRLLGLARPLAELAIGAELHQRGVDVPKPVFVVAVRRGFFWTATLATEFQADAPSGGEFLRGASGEAQVREATRAAARAIRTLHDAGACHADLHVDNLLVAAREDLPVRVLVTDLDGARLVPAVTAQRRMLELMRLYRSLRKRGLTAAADVRACAAFLGTYAAGDRRLRREMLSHAQRERARAAVHALGYRSAQGRRESRR